MRTNQACPLLPLLHLHPGPHPLPLPAAHPHRLPSPSGLLSSPFLCTLLYFSRLSLASSEPLALPNPKIAGQRPLVGARPLEEAVGRCPFCTRGLSCGGPSLPGEAQVQSFWGVSCGCPYSPCTPRLGSDLVALPSCCWHTVGHHRDKVGEWDQSDPGPRLHRSSVPSELLPAHAQPCMFCSGLLAGGVWHTGRCV